MHAFGKFSGQWLPAGKSATPEADISGLQEGKTYKFRVKAVNKEGESEELETEKPIVAKNPFGTNIFLYSQYVSVYSSFRSWE